MARRPFGRGYIARSLKISVLMWCAFASLSWIALQVDRRTLAGLSVNGQTIPRTTSPEEVLWTRAQPWMAEELRVRTGSYLTRATRSDLGASLDASVISARLLSVGRTGRPLADAVALWRSWLGYERDFIWEPAIDRNYLDRYVQALRRNVERPPVAGVTDDFSQTLPGIAGVSLDTGMASELIARSILRGQKEVSMPLLTVPPPAALALGLPDSSFDEYDEYARAAPADAPSAPTAHPPIDWMPSHGPECDLDPGYEGFCQGPRRVPKPHGEAASLAQRLGLGQLETIAELLRRGARREWVESVGGAEPAPTSLLWPVGGGVLWRPFGCIRQRELREKLHRGVDIGAARRTPIVAVNDGIVAYSDNRVRGYGNLLVVVHRDGSVTLTAHCQAIYVFAGQRVRRGQWVADVGDTGFARGPHVHFEYHRAGRAIDPLRLFEGGPVLKRRAAAPAAGSGTALLQTQTACRRANP